MKLSRSAFIERTTFACSAIMLSTPWMHTKLECNVATEDALHDWTLWKKHQAQVSYPSLSIERQDLRYAKAHMVQHDWARNYAHSIIRKADSYQGLLKANALQDLIQTTTPGAPLWTPCPACRDKGLPVHPHRDQKKWSVIPGALGLQRRTYSWVGARDKKTGKIQILEPSFPILSDEDLAKRSSDLFQYLREWDPLERTFFV